MCPLIFMFGNIWWSTKLLLDLVIFSIFSSNISSDFLESIRVVSLKHLMYLLAGKNSK